MSDESKRDAGEPFAEAHGSADVRWRCPACGAYRATLKMPEETMQQAANRLIDDHIRLGCAAYPPNAELSHGREHDKP